MKKNLIKFVRSYWFYPAILVVFLLIMTAFGVNGSSVGVIQQSLGEPVDGLIAGAPKSIRSDEWLVTTPMTIAQAENNFEVINNNIGNGQDMSVTLDIPYREWSILFKPQNLSFFVLPFDNAFAFKWWSLTVVLLLAVYVVILSIFPKQKFLAIALSLFMLFSPFIQWWYQSITILPIAYTLIILSIVIYFIKHNEKLQRWKKLALSILLGYLTVNFALVLYPAFQIPCLFVMLIILIAWYLGNYKLGYIFRAKQWLWLVVPIFTAALIAIAFLLQHHEAVSATLNTAYPGQRSVESGGSNIIYYLSWPLSYLDADSIMNNFNSNQSEFSKFIFIGLLILTFQLFISIKNYLKDKLKNRASLYLCCGLTIITVFILVIMFVPFGDAFYDLLGFGSVPHKRLMVALGLVNLFIIALSFTTYEKKRSWKDTLLDKKSLIAFPIITIFVALGLLLVKNTFGVDGMFLSINKEILLLSIAIGLISATIINSNLCVKVAGVICAVILSLAGSFYVNPLQQGTAPVIDNALSKTIKTIGDNNERLIIDNMLLAETLPAANGAWSLNTLFTYPQMNFWKTYFPDADPAIYNRYEHITVNVNDSIGARSVELIQSDHVKININSCDLMIKDLHIKYIIRDRQNNPPDFLCFTHVNNIIDGKMEILQRIVDKPADRQ